MQWLIDIIEALCNAYTDQAILDAKVIPSGTVIMWTGIYDDIPDGWVPCDGTNGTPDLLGLFVRAAGDGHPVNETGGTSQHSHPCNSEHSHELHSGVAVGSGKVYSYITTTDPALFDTENSPTIPPYYCLWYIMKL